jgi:hypothetical protein
MQMDKNVHVPSLDLGIQYHNIGFFQQTFRTRKRVAIFAPVALGSLESAGTRGLQKKVKIGNEFNKRPVSVWAHEYIDDLMIRLSTYSEAPVWLGVNL